MKQQDRLPSFLIIGAVKAATTWLTWQLQQSPGVFLPDPEPHYFTREYRRGLDWYKSFFEHAAPHQLIGEKTADYLAKPEAPERVLQLLPDASLIIQLRDPVDRAYSDYCMLFRRGTVSADIGQYLDPRKAEFRRFLDYGLYHAHLRRWFEVFPQNQFMIFLFEDVIDSPDSTLKAVGQHIGLTQDLIPKAATERVNDSRAALLPLALRKALAPVKSLAVPLRGAKWFEAARSTLARPVAYPALSNELEERLRDFYAADVQALQGLIGRDLKHWTASIRNAA